MTIIRQEDLIQSIADAFQYISYYHPLDYIQALGEAYAREESPAAKDAIAQILTNSRMAAEGHRPICQDTGIAVVFLKVGMNVQWDAKMSVQEMINEGVRRAYNDPDNKLRASVLLDPAGKRQNSKDNTPAVVHYEIVEGDDVEVICAAKGGGSENKSKMAMLNPSDSIVDWVLKTVPTMGAGWCPPGMLGIGIGGTAEKAVLLAKESLMDDLDMYELQAKASKGEKLDRVEEMRLELYEKVNALGIGAQGLGGLTTVLDIKVKDYPTHAANLPVAMIPNCAATRHAHFVLDGSGPAYIFYVVEAMIEAGVVLGMPRTTATELVVQTLFGAATMIKETGQHPTVLREQVSSPGGTTVAALRQLDDHKVRAAFVTAQQSSHASAPSSGMT